MHYYSLEPQKLKEEECFDESPNTRLNNQAQTLI